MVRDHHLCEHACRKDRRRKSEIEREVTIKKKEFGSREKSCSRRSSASFSDFPWEKSARHLSSSTYRR